MEKCDRKDYLWITKEPSGNLLLGTSTVDELAEEDKEYVENQLNEDQ